MSHLVVVSPDGATSTHVLDADSTTIGRSLEAELTLPDEFMSRQHARVIRRGQGFILEDLGSRNGTKLNGRRIKGSADLTPGDKIKISNYTLRFETDPKAARAPAASESGVSSDSGAIEAKPSKTDIKRFQSGASILVPVADLLSGKLDAMAAAAEEQVDIDRHLDRLRMLKDVHESLAASISIEDLLELILDRVFEHLSPEEGVVILKQEDGTFQQVAGRRADDAPEDSFYSTTLIHEVAEKLQAALVLDAQTDERFADAKSVIASGIKSIVAAPLAVDDQGLGLIAMSSRLSVRQFTERDLELLGSLASVASLRINNVSLALDAAERQRLEAEVRLARTIQETLLPSELPEVPGYEVAATNYPSQGVSGDLYQVLQAETSDTFYFFLCDVSGKGLAASLLTATIEALAASPIAQSFSPDRVCARVNDQLEARTPPDRFATAFLATLDAATGELTYASAGHNPALVLRAEGAVERLVRTGLPLAAMPGGEYESVDIALAEGDALVIYSDGLTEAADPDDNEYGLDRLEEVCKKHLQEPLTKMVEAIEHDMDTFAAGTPFFDDRTLVVVRRATS